MYDSYCMSHNYYESSLTPDSAVSPLRSGDRLTSCGGEDERRRNSLIAQITSINISKIKIITVGFLFENYLARLKQALRALLSKKQQLQNLDVNINSCREILADMCRPI